MTGELQREYAYDNARAAQGARLGTLEAIFDAGTIAELEARGVGGGWRCLEVGAGGGSIALWLADRVAPEGAVLATDLDTTVLAGLSRPGPELAERFKRMVAAHHAVIAERHGFDPHYGRRLAGDLTDAGLAESGCLGRASMWRAGEAGGDIWRMSFEQLRDGVVDMRLMDAAEADAAIALCSDPRFSTLSPVMMAAWGRRA